MQLKELASITDELKECKKSFTEKDKLTEECKKQIYC